MSPAGGLQTRAIAWLGPPGISTSKQVAGWVPVALSISEALVLFGGSFLGVDEYQADVSHAHIISCGVTNDANITQ